MQTKCSVAKGARRPRDGQTARGNTHRRHDYAARLPHGRGATTALQTLRKRPGRAALVEPREIDRSGRGTRQRREADSPKNLYTSCEASAICSQRKNGRTPTPDGNGRRKWKRRADDVGEPPPLVRAIRSASASARFGADSGAAGGRLGNGGGVQMRFQMSSKHIKNKVWTRGSQRTGKRILWHGELVYM